MTHDLYMQKDVQRVLCSVSFGMEATAVALRTPTHSASSRAYRKGAQDALMAVALAFGLVPVRRSTPITFELEDERE